MGFLFRWIFRGLVVWAAMAAVHSCGDQHVYADDVPFQPLRRAGSSR
ncbi:hypothetical protein KAK07_02810 [Ideonella sp. 4Y16]|nr:hypothetical protein [Ideonella alba]MBQ0942261.1 hypothetical protein [Ideonella alba]